MCTVTFVPVKDGTFITSNRDERHIRKPALRPQLYKHNNSAVIYPKDADAGGTWVAMKDNGDAAVLLNGGFIKHIVKPQYRKSRGLVFLDIVNACAPAEHFSIISLDKIEPFTLILFVDNNLFECRWDGHKKYMTSLSNKTPRIWSSVTLYDDEVIKKRAQWFEGWLKNNPSPLITDILDFHRFGGNGDAHNDIRMNRDGVYYTVSITAMHLTNAKNTMHYLDLKSNQSFTKQIDVRSFMAV